MNAEEEYKRLAVVGDQAFKKVQKAAEQAHNDYMHIVNNLLYNWWRFN